MTINKLVATPHNPWTLKSCKLILEPTLIVSVLVTTFFSTTTKVDGGTEEADPLESVVIWLGMTDVNVVAVVVALTFSGIGVGVTSTVDVESFGALLLQNDF